MKQLVITTKSWKALIESLKGNSKHSYNKLDSLKQADGYFTAVLCQNTDSAYTERLKIVTGDEDETGTLLYFLSLQPQPIALQLTPEEGEVVGPVQTEAVQLKVERKPRARKTKQ